MLKIVARLGDIPVGSTVTKLGGTYEYVVKEKIDIYKEDGAPDVIYAKAGCLFLVGAAGSMHAFGYDKELVWHTCLAMLVELAEEKEAK